MNLSSLIEQNRKGHFSVNFINATRGTKVSYTLTRLNFELGTVLFRSYYTRPETDSDRRHYLLHIDKYFNSILIPIFWHAIEPEPSKYNDQPYLSIADWCKKHQKKTLGHAIFYGSDGLDDADPADEQLPFVQPWVRELKKDELENAMMRQLRHVLTLFEGKISDYVLNSKPPRPKGGALTTPTPKIFCYPMKQLAHIRSKVTSQNPFPVLRCPYQRILAIIDCVTGPSESHRMPPESICVSVV